MIRVVVAGAYRPACNEASSRRFLSAGLRAAWADLMTGTSLNPPVTVGCTVRSTPGRASR
jgi:hypothetical protein